MEKTPSKFDRSVQPAMGESPQLDIPESWTTQLSNQLEVYGIEQKELPLVNFSLMLDGGHLLDDLQKNGVANLMTDILMEGTANKNPGRTGRGNRSFGCKHQYVYDQREHCYPREHIKKKL